MCKGNRRGAVGNIRWGHIIMGKIQVKLFPGGTLGGDQQTLSAIQGGILDMTMMGPALLVGQVKEYAVLDLPYLVRDEASAFKLLDSKVVQDELLAKGNAAGFHLVNFWEVTFRNIYTRPLRPLIVR